MKSCGICDYWKKDEGDSGNCHRHAPQGPVVEGYEVRTYSTWPKTDRGQWCGDYTTKPFTGNSPTVVDPSDLGAV